MKKALIDGARICEVRNATFPVSPPLQWVDVPDDTTDRDTWDGVQVVKAPNPPVLTIEQLRVRERAGIAEGARQARYTYLTWGKDPVYEAKREEVVRWDKALSPRTLSEYPWMRRRAARKNGIAVGDLLLVTELQMQAVADEWRTLAGQWAAKGQDIEDVYEGAVERVDAAAQAGDRAALLAVRPGLVWP